MVSCFDGWLRRQVARALVNDREEPPSVVRMRANFESVRTHQTSADYT